MQKDTEIFSNSDLMMHSEAASGESSVKPFQCSHCTLVFKSKVYLFEHLNKVHGLDVDRALRGAGLKQTGNKEAKRENKSSSSGNVYLCQHCDFTTHQRDVFDKHEKECPRNREKKRSSGYVYVTETPETTITATSANQQKEGARLKGVTCTSTPKCSIDSSKDLKTYKRPMQTITKYLKASSETNGNPPAKLPDSSTLLDQTTKGTLILQESPSESSGVFKVTAKSTIDIPKNVSDLFLLNDHYLINNKRIEKPQANSRDSSTNKANKRTKNERAEGPSAKKVKSCSEETEKPSSPDFSFDISEDEDSLHLVNGDKRSSKGYFCKHCDFSDASLTCMSDHYQNAHPYVRFNFVYIKDPSDQSARFRCLECPVDFSSLPELKRHYKENHPSAPDVLLRQSHKLSLAFKCFACQFTTLALKILKEHYKETHPTYKMDNSLLYCRYAVTECQAVSSRLNSREKTPERSEKNSPQCVQTSSEDVQNKPLHSTTRPADGAYQCNSCNFRHKSVVVMHVHYQRIHPDEPVTIDKIKHSHSALQVMPEKSSNPTQKNTSDSSEEDKAELTQQNATVSSMSPVQTLEVSNSHLKSPKLQKMPSADRSKTKSSFSKYEKDVTAEMGSSPDRLFHCQFCSYSSTKIRSVVGHHNAKHAINGPTSVEEILCHSAKVQKKKLQSEARASEESQTSNQVVVHSKKELFLEMDDEEPSMSGFNAYSCAEQLFYCQKCNFANPSLKGVLNHQSKIHKKINSNKECILRHTALICKDIEKSKSQTKKRPFATNLPLPILNEGDENAFFCHFCNYRNSTIDRLMKHYFKNHSGFKITSEKIRKHTSKIFEKTQLSECNPATFGEKQNDSNKSNELSVSDSRPPSAGDSEKPRALQCHRCSFITQYFYVLRRHVWTDHKANRTTSEILRFCFKQGCIQSGYHCFLCVFSDKKAEEVYQHYLEQHPDRKLSLEYISTQLYVGPDLRPLKKKKRNIKNTNILPSPTSVEDESKTYSCKLCSFQASLMSDFTGHYHTVHPWSVKEDGSVPGVKISKKKGTNSQLKEDDEILSSFESYQIPIEFDKSLDSSDESKQSDAEFKCSFCPATFLSQRSLSTHCGMKHQSAPLEKCAEGAANTQKPVDVFRCLHCTYFNSNYQGVLTHCNIKHPYLECKAESFRLHKTPLKSLKSGSNKSSSGKDLKYRGYICKTCQYTFQNVEKMNRHCEKYHKKPVSNIIKPAAKTSAMSKLKQTNTFSTHRLVSKASFIRKKKYAVIHCPQCRFFCTTNIALTRHLRVQHAEPSVADVKDDAYKCALCSKSYFRKKRLGNHYMKKHGKDAFVTYFNSAHRQVAESTPEDQLSTNSLKSTSEASNSSPNTEEKLIFYKCPGCPYVNASYHGTLTHCQMVHPDLLVRADRLERAETCIDNMVRGRKGKIPNRSGYMCNQCPLVHASMATLKTHSRFHDPVQLAASELFDEDANEQQPEESFSESMLEEDSVKNKEFATNTTEINLSQQSGPPETSQSNARSAQFKDVFKCHICNYKGSHRKYLYCHYKHTHKLDAISIFKLLEKHYKYKRNINKLRATQSEESAHHQCKKCPDLTFNSSQLLIAHYSTFHCQSDFTVLSRRYKKNTGSYKCSQCKKLIHGINNLCCHLDRHRAWRMKKANEEETQMLSIVTPTPNEPNEQNEQPLLETREDLAQCEVAPSETFNLPSSPSQSLSEPTYLKPQGLKSGNQKHTCNMCRRAFMSLKGLRSHERSHAALAAIKKLDKVPASEFKQFIDNYLVYKPGTTRPFMCTCCFYRTPVLSLWRSHVMRKHHDVFMEPEEAQMVDEKIAQSFEKDPYSTEENIYSSEPNEDLEMTEKLLYLEPPAVQQQLNQYSLMAQIGVTSKMKLQKQLIHEKSLLHCEFCNFTCRQMARIRKHYLSRHGKKVFRCKDCDFFSGLRQTLEKHRTTGHPTCQSEPTHQKDFCCPFCLYQTKNKDSMIDHIVLHREERVVPIEVRRSKLSHYLQGIVFRCHKCTFSSGSAENLHFHMIKHNDIKPYKCRLCYFDCTQLSDLEEHLSDKHQVVRNHELVGQVSLDELDATVSKMPEEKEESLSKLKQRNNENKAVEKEVVNTDCNDILHETLAKNSSQHDIREKTALPMVENEQDPQERPEVVHLHNTAKRSRIKKDGQVRKAAAKSKDFRDPEEESRGQTSQIESVDRNKKLAPIKQEAIEPNEASLKGVLLNQTQVLDEGFKKGLQSRTVKIEQSSDSEVADTEQVNLSSRATTEAISAFHIKKQPNNKRAPENLKVEKETQTSMPSCPLLMKSQGGNFGVPITNCKKEVLGLKTTERMTDPYLEMPVLEKVFLKEEMSPLQFCKKEKETDPVEQKQNKGEKLITKDENRCNGQEQMKEGRIKSADIQDVHRGMDSVGAAEVLCPSVMENRLYTCELCGRKLTNNHELKRHVMRHGI